MAGLNWHRSFERIGSRCRPSLTLAALVLAVAPLLALQGTPSPQDGSEHWVGTWATATVGRPQSPVPPALPAPSAAPRQQPASTAPLVHFTNQTLRQVVHTSIAGSRLRVVVSNAFGTAPLVIGAAHLALRAEGAAIVTASGHALTFGGRSSIVVPAGAVLFSDPVSLAAPAMADLSIDLYLPGSTNVPSPLTMHNTALQTSYVSEAGNHAGAAALPVAATTQNSFLLARVEVSAPRSVGAIVAMGASITDGSRSTPDTNSRWPNQLARRLAGRPAPMAVLNAGIGGNRLLSEGAFQSGPNGLARFGRDVLEQTGVSHVIVADMALNDIGNARENAAPTADDLIAAQRQLIERAHAKGLRIYGATLTPFEGAGYFTEAGEAKRQAVNRWIRTSGVYDGVIDFDAATRDPDHPARFLPRYDSGDHLHPSDAGYRAMGDAIDLSAFEARGAQATSRR